MMRFVDGRMVELSPAETLKVDFEKGREFDRRARSVRVAEFTEWRIGLAQLGVGINGRHIKLANDIHELFGTQLAEEQFSL